MHDIVPPQAIEIEQSIICSMIMDNECAAEACEFLTADDFYRTDHRKAFEAIAELVKAGKPVELATVHEMSKVSAVYLATIINTVPVSVSVEHHAEIIGKKRQLRELMNVCLNAITALQGADHNGDEVIEKIKRQVSDIGCDPQKPVYLRMDKITEESVDRYEEIQQAKTVPGIKTGFRQIDYITGGFIGAKLIVIAARPGIGKTAFMGSLAMNMAKAGRSIGIFELEMSRQELDDRWFSMLTGINSAKLTTGNGLWHGDWLKITAAAESKHSWNVFVDDKGGLTIEQIRSRAKKMVRDGAEIIFIDQLSKIGGNRKLSSYERNTAHVEELGWLKKDLGIPVVVLCQLNRQLEMRGDKYPQLSDLKLTGQIEEEADMVFLGHRPAVYMENPTPEDQARAIWDLQKNRSGPTYKFQVHWEPRLTRFFDIETRV